MECSAKLSGACSCAGASRGAGFPSEDAAVPLRGIFEGRRLEPSKKSHRYFCAVPQAGIYVWDGNYYAINVTERLGLEGNGGMVRVGAAHYNTLEEVERLRAALNKIALS